MIRLTDRPFDPGAESNRFMAGRSGAGAAVTFTGLVRSTPGDAVSALLLECYPELAENEIAGMRERAIARFGLIDAGVIHRWGRLLPGEPIMQVMVLAAHRGAAFAGAEFLMDYLKTDAPFWKKEETPSGPRWVEARPEDERRRAAWGGDDL
jgi:molybdopterin synthase catalytic subunit